MKKNTIKYVIYKATFENGKFYIGMTNNLIKRKSCHKRRAENGSTSHFHNAIRKYGFNTIKWEVISEHKTWDEMVKAEEEAITKLNPHYNITAGGISPKMTDETKDKIRKAKLGKRFSKEARKNMSDSKKEWYSKRGKKENGDNRIRINNYRNLYIKGQLKESTFKKILILKDIYVVGMSLNELCLKSGISYSEIIRLDWLWLEDLDKYIDNGRPSNKGYKLKINKDKDIRWRQKSINRKKKLDRILLLSKLDTKNKTIKEISNLSGINESTVQNLHRCWEDIIEEEGF
jgi:predicted GIY-YIG superfamily endonuclease